MLLMDKIAKRDARPAIVKPRVDPVDLPSHGLVQLKKRDSVV